MKDIDTFVKATDEFLDACAHIGDVDSATLNGIKTAAVELDNKFTTSLWQEYNKTVRYIKSLAPQTEGDTEDDDLLSPQD